MLVLTRKEVESILIQSADDIEPDITVEELLHRPIEITVTQIKGGQVRVGVKSPRSLAVARE